MGEQKKERSTLGKLIDESGKYLNLTQNININYEKNQTEFNIEVDYDDGPSEKKILMRVNDWWREKQATKQQEAEQDASPNR